MVGVGAELNGDDAVGVIIARKLQPLLREQPDVFVLEGGSVPESIIGPLRKFSAELVILIDATDLRDEPGTIRWIDQNQICGSSFSTHSLPLTLLCQFLEQEISCEVLILGVQPESIEFGQPLSTSCKKAASQITTAIAKLLCSPQ